MSNSDEDKLKSIYVFDYIGNIKNFERVKDDMNKAHSMLFLSIGVHESGQFSIHTELNERDLRELLEKVINVLHNGKAVVSLDKV